MSDYQCRPTQGTGQFFNRMSPNHSFPRPGVRMKKSSPGGELPGYGGTQVADGLILGGKQTKKNNKKLPTGAENITRGEGRLTLGKTAPAVPFLTSPGSPGLAARARLPLAPPSPHQTHTRRARHTRHSPQALPRAGVHKRGHGLTGIRERVDFAYSTSV